STTLFTFYDGPQRDPMLKSLDGGMNWTNSASGMSATGVELVVDPSDTKILYEAQVQGSGVYRTTDGGENWYAMNNGLPLGQFAWPNWGVKTLVCDPATKGRLFAGIDALGALGGVYIYENEVWTQSNTGLSPGTITIEVRSIVVDHRDPGIDPVLYASVLNAGIFRSDDGGLKWHPMNNGFPIQTQCDRIVMDKDDPLILYAATGAGVYKTINGGAEWKLVGSPSVAQYIALHPQNPNTAYVGYWEYGIYRTIDGGTTWSSMNEGLLNTRFHWLGVEPNNPGYLFLGNPRGLYRYISPSLFFTDLKLYQPVKAGDLVGAVLGGVMNNPAAEDGGESRQVRARLQLENLDQNLITSAKYENPDSLDNWLDATLASDSAGGTYVQTPSFTFTPSSSKHCNFRLTVSATTPMGTHRTVLSLIEDGTNWVLATKTGQLTVVLESASALNGAVILPGTGVHLAVTGSGTGWGGVYTSQPTGTTTPPGSVLKYLDVCFTPAGEASGTATVMVEYTTTGTYILSFWDGAQWRLADPQWDEPANHRVVGHVPYIYLQGTPFALAGQQGPTQTGTIALTVVDPEGHLLAGASFRLGPGSIDQTTDGTHNPLLWGGLSLGNYTLTQLSAPSGFLPDPTFPRSLTLPSVEEPLLSLTATCPLQGPVSVPSLSIWGLASLALALLGGGVWRLRRKNKA
ncbi:MAG: IPTL-CTERM sorting domain-containing protein, partial [bacterium]